MSGSRAGAQALTFASTVLLARALTLEDYGRYVFAQALASIAIMAFDHGSQFQLVQQLPRGASSAANLLGRAWAARHALALLILPAVGIVAVLDPRDPRRLAASALLLVGGLWDADQLLAFASFRAGGRLPREALWTGGSALVRLGLTVVGVLLRLPLVPLLLMLVLGKLFAAVLAVWDARRAAPFRVIGEWRHMGPYLLQAAPFGLFALTGVAYFQSGTIMVSAMSGHREAAVFQAGYMLFLGALLLPDAIATAHYAGLSQAYMADRARYRREFTVLVLRLAVAGLAVGLLLAIVGPWSIRLLFPSGFADAASVSRGLGLALFVRSLNYAYGTGLHAGDGERARAWNNVAALGILLVAGAIAVKRWGALGMVGAMGVSELALLALEIAATRALRRDPA